MSSIEQLETLRNAELYDDCKIVVIDSFFEEFYQLILLIFFSGGISSHT